MSVIEPRHRATVHDYLSLADGGPRYELIQGELRMAPAPNTRHQRISRELELLICNHLREHPAGELLHAPCDVFLSEINVLQPDLLYISRNRAKLISERGVEGAPDLVVEILSPTSEKQDRGAKKAVYAAAGVTEYWIVDPERETVEVYFPRQDPTILAATYHAGDTLKTDQLPHLELDLEAVFAPARR